MIIAIGEPSVDSLVSASLLLVADLLEERERLFARALVVGGLLLPVARTQQVLHAEARGTRREPNRRDAFEREIR